MFSGLQLRFVSVRVRVPLPAEVSWDVCSSGLKHKLSSSRFLVTLLSAQYITPSWPSSVDSIW